MSSLAILSNQDLLDVYGKAKKYELEKMFIETLLIEIKRRGIDIAAAG